MYIYICLTTATNKNIFLKKKCIKRVHDVSSLFNMPTTDNNSHYMQ